MSEPRTLNVFERTDGDHIPGVQDFRPRMMRIDDVPQAVHPSQVEKKAEQAGVTETSEPITRPDWLVLHIDLDPNDATSWPPDTTVEYIHTDLGRFLHVHWVSPQPLPDEPDASAPAPGGDTGQTGHPEGWNDDVAEIKALLDADDSNA